MTYEFHPEAEQEFVEAAAYYEQMVTGLGQRFGSEVRHAIERLLEYPELGSPVDEDLHRLVLIRFPYIYLQLHARHAHDRRGGSCPSSSRILASES